jgi:hypothetical protein
LISAIDGHRAGRQFTLWEAGERLPSQQPNSVMRCACGETFDSHRLEESRSASLISAQPMKFVERSHFTDPSAAACKLVEVSTATETTQEGRL